MEIAFCHFEVGECSVSEKPVVAFLRFEDVAPGVLVGAKLLLEC